MSTVCVRVVKLDTSSAFFQLVPKNVPYLAALVANANIGPAPPVGSPLAVWEAHCTAAGTFALNTVVSGWPTSVVTPSISGGGVVGWQPGTGGVAIGPYVVADSDANEGEVETLWAEFFPCSDVGLDTRTIELELCNDSGMDANGILLEFTFGRTEILRASVIEEKKVILNRPHTKAFQCGVVAAGAHTKLRLTYRMDPPAFRTSRSDPPLFFVTWLAPNGTPPPAAPDRFAPLPSPLRLNGPGDVAEIRRVARAHEPNVEQLRAKRDADIAATPGNPRVYKQFFADLDFQTNPRLGGASATAAVYMQLKRVLQDRFVRRASGPGVGSVPTPAAALLERELVRKVAMDVAAQLQGMIKNAFGPLLAFKAGNAPNFEEALEMFASGSLTSFDAHGAPDGPLMLALGEFALLLKELAGTPMPTHYQGKPIPAPAADIPDIDWAFWKQLLPVMCRVSEIFARCYHNPWPGHSYTMQAYTPNDNPNGRRGLDPYGTSGQADLAILQSIRTAWSSMDTAGEFARTIASALRNDPLVVTHGPHKVMPLIKPELAGRTWECANEVGSHERDQAMPEAEID